MTGGVMFFLVMSFDTFEVKRTRGTVPWGYLKVFEGTAEECHAVLKRIRLGLSK